MSAIKVDRRTLANWEAVLTYYGTSEEEREEIRERMRADADYRAAKFDWCDAQAKELGLGN